MAVHVVSILCTFFAVLLILTLYSDSFDNEQQLFLDSPIDLSRATNIFVAG